MENSYIETDLDVVKYLNSRTCDQIIDMLEGKNLIGKGFWGFVYKLDIKGHKVSAKIQPLANTKTWDPSVVDPRDIKLEIELLKTLSQYKITNSFIHFPYFYKEVTCQDQNIMFYEYYSSNLKDVLIKSQDITFEDFKNISIQILISIYFFQQITKYYHNDIHVENFLVNYLSQPIEQTYNFITLGLKKGFIFNKVYIGIWDFANAIPIPINNSTNPTNPDYIQFKQMLPSFVKKIIDQLVDYENIVDFCNNINHINFEQYYKKELKTNKLKWAHIKNTKKAIDKIDKSMKKSLIYWIIENRYLDQMIEYLKKKKLLSNNLNLPTQLMLDWIYNLPNSLEDAISSF